MLEQMFILFTPLCHETRVSVRLSAAFTIQFTEGERKLLVYLVLLLSLFVARLIDSDKLCHRIVTHTLTYYKANLNLLQASCATECKNFSHLRASFAPQEFDKLFDQCVKLCPGVSCKKILFTPALIATRESQDIVLLVYDMTGL